MNVKINGSKWYDIYSRLALDPIKVADAKKFGKKSPGDRVIAILDMVGQKKEAIGHLYQKVSSDGTVG